MSGRIGSIRSGLAWTGLEKVVVYGVTFVQGVVLARLLKPEDFGSVAMLGLFVGVSGVLAESGLGTALVVKVPSCGARSCEQSAFRWNIVVATLLYVALWVCSPSIARWYGIPFLESLLKILSLGMVFSAAGVVAVARLTREQQFDRLATVNIIAVVASVALGVSLAFAGFGVWAIAWISVLQPAIRTVLSWIVALYGKSPPDCARSVDVGHCSLKSLLGYGGRLTASGLVHTAYCNLYGLVIGKLWSPATVGLFVRGDRWSHLPGEVVNDAITRVSLPKLAQKECGPRYIASVNAILLWPVLATLWVFAPFVVKFVLGKQWVPCVPYLRILLLGQIVTPVTTASLNFLKARGRADLVLATDFIKKPIGLSALFAGCGFGLVGVCWAKVASDVVECIVDVFAAFKARREEMPVDLVYCWCNGPKFEDREKCRFSENGELRYSILSADRYAPWIRKMFVLVNDETVIPDWLSEHAKVTIVRHSDIIPKEILPLYNPASIELWMNRIPGLSEYFIYGNDDMFFGRKVRKSDFFDSKGRMLCRYLLGVSLKDSLRTGHTYERWLENNRKLLGSGNDWLPHHNFDPYRKSVIDEFWQTFPKEALASASYRERTPDQLQREVFALYAMNANRGAYGKVRHFKIFWDSLYAELCDVAAMEKIRRVRPKMFCLNDSERSSDEDRLRMARFLRDFYGV